MDGLRIWIHPRERVIHDQRIGKGGDRGGGHGASRNSDDHGQCSSRLVRHWGDLFVRERVVQDQEAMRLGVAIRVMISLNSVIVFGTGTYTQTHEC